MMWREMVVLSILICVLAFTAMSYSHILLTDSPVRPALMFLSRHRLLRFSDKLSLRHTPSNVFSFIKHKPNIAEITILHYYLCFCIFFNFSPTLPRLWRFSFTSSSDFCLSHWGRSAVSWLQGLTHARPLLSHSPALQAPALSLSSCYWLLLSITSSRFHWHILIIHTNGFHYDVFWSCLLLITLPMSHFSLPNWTPFLLSTPLCVRP